MPFYDSVRDPIDNSVAYYYHWRSTSSTGGSTTILNDIYIPATPNFPPVSTGSQTRYITYMPGKIYYNGITLGTHPLVVVNVNTTTILTRVLSSGTLTANTYKVFQQTADTPSRIEFHVGVGSNQAGDKIAYDGYFFNSILSSTYYNSINPTSTQDSTSYDTGAFAIGCGFGIAGNIYNTGDVIPATYIYGAGGWNMYEHYSTGATSYLKQWSRLLKIGIWDIEASTSIRVNIGTTVLPKVKRLEYVLFQDTQMLGMPLGKLHFSMGGASSGYYFTVNWSGGFSSTGGWLSNNNWNDTTLNRGYIYIEYST